MRIHSLKRKLLILLNSFLLPILLTGCIEEYDKGDIKDYVVDQLGITAFSVSKDTLTYVDEDDYEDTIWTVTVNKTGLTFHVIDDHSWGLEWATNYLKNDYHAAVFNFIQDDLPDLQYLDTHLNIEDDSTYTSTLSGSFTNKEELKACYDELVMLKTVFTDLGYDGLSIGYTLEYNHPLRTTIPTYTESSGDSNGHTDYDFTYEEMRNRMIQTALDYRYDCISTFTEQELNEALTDYDDPVGVYTGTETESENYDVSDVRYYEDIIANKYSYGISFGSLYEILLREGFDVKGDAWHYSFTGLNDIVYEISYDFLVDDYEDNKLGYYYLANQEQVLMNACFYNHFWPFKIEEMTGLKLVTVQL